MRKGALILLPLLVCPAAFGQLDSNAITVSASNNTTVQPDQAIFGISVQSGITTGLEDVLTALQGSGITAANFAGVSSQNQFLNTGRSAGSTLIWVFTLTAPLANTKPTVANLTTLQQNIAKANNGLSLSFSLAGTQISQQLAQAQTCSLSSLITSATTQAQNLASASGLTLGSIVGIASSSGNLVSSPVFIPNPYISVVVNGVAPAPCAITVKFALNRR
jgi:uncharacterized protein YggE